MRQVLVKGPVLLLLGPIGEFFSRFAKYLIKSGVQTHKITFPYKECFIPSAITHPFSKPLDEFHDFLKQFLEQHNIKQIYMSADFSSIHQTAIKLANTMNIDAYVFELGYVRPNYITLEKNCVNARSNLNKPASFYHALPHCAPVVEEKTKKTWLWRKWVLPFLFIQQTLTDFDIIPGEHKSNPKPKFLWNQTLGCARYFIYQWSEAKLRHKIEQLDSFYLLPLQVDSDSQITLSSSYSGMVEFITEAIASFSRNACFGEYLVIKHHPADRGYNNYKKLISKLAKKYQRSPYIIYIHDMDLNALYKKCQGLVTINSTVGLEALRHRVAVKVMGETFYNMEGLSYQGSLDDFWQADFKMDKVLYTKFYRHMIQTTQLRGNFHAPFDFSQSFLTQIEPVYKESMA